MVFVLRGLGFWLLRTVGIKVYQDLRAGNSRVAVRRMRRAVKIAVLTAAGTLASLLLLLTLLTILLFRALG